jgi:hypothetical protein
MARPFSAGGCNRSMIPRALPWAGLGRLLGAQTLKRPNGVRPGASAAGPCMIGCGSAALRCALVTHSSRHGLRPFVRDSDCDAERVEQGDSWRRAPSGLTM